MNIHRWGVLATLLFFIMAGPVGAALSNETSAEPIVVNGDEVEYFPDEKKVVGKGHISIDYQGSILTADAITVYLDTKDAEAEGEVVLTRGLDEFRGKHLRYNFDTKEGILTDARGKVLPWYFGGEKVERQGEDKFLVEGGYLTTCDLFPPHYSIRTKRIEIHSGNRIVARNVTFQTGGVPIFYSPVYTRSIKEGVTQRAGAGVIPGYSNRWGGYILSTWALPLSEGISSNVHLDERSRRGFGIGLDTEYDTKVGKGEIKTYTLNDRKRQSPIGLREDKDRYRARWLHRWEMTPSTLFLGEYQKWGDRFITRDYFNGEFSEDFRPETRATVIHDSSFVTTAFTVEKRANHFFSETERLPELQVTSQRLPLWETGLYYQGELNAGSLTRAIADSDSHTTSGRVDFFNELSYAKNFSGIEVVPLASTHQTYYGQDLTGEEEVVRGLATVGVDVSTRMRRFYDVQTSFWGLELNGFRHILEPGLEYRYTPEPTLLPSRLPPFDEIDLLTEKNRLTFSLDNKFQTRRTVGEREGEVVDFLDFVLKSNLDFRSSGEGQFRDIVGDLELRPSSFWGAILESTYDIEKRNVARVNLDLFAFQGDRWRLDFLQRFEEDFSNQLTTKLSWRMSPLWKIELYDRFEVYDKQFEEEEVVLSRDLHCWEGSLGVNIRDTEDLERSKAEVTVYVALRLKAFPGAPIELGNRASISRRLIGDRRSGEME
ncbi:MAG: LPS assembly protein LptD [Candidatus Omnitrophica bacterium]|nr:LPS assembly protein LptD [Candidatus Omnitrophota bacterium]